MEKKTHDIDQSILRTFTQNVFLSIGCPQEDAVLAADVLIKADLRGVDSHGIARLGGYVRLWEKGRINPTPSIKIIHETPSTASIDGDKGLGLVVAPKAMKIAINKAKAVGSGWIAVKNSNHFGIAAYHALMATEQDMIGYAMTNASPLVAPTFSKERMLGTNPICYTFPAGKYPPFVLDMATAAAANGKLEIAQRNGKSIPTGWALNRAGLPSQDPYCVRDGGSLLPLGGDRLRGGHKGFGLSASVDILSAVLSGAGYGPWAPPFVAYLEPHPKPVGEGLGHFLGAMRVDGFRPLDEFQHHMDQWISRFKQAKAIDEQQPVIIPGEPELASEKERSLTGIPVVNAVFDELNQLADKFKITKL